MTSCAMRCALAGTVARGLPRLVGAREEQPGKPGSTGLRRISRESQALCGCVLDHGDRAVDGIPIHLPVGHEAHLAAVRAVGADAFGGQCSGEPV